MNFNVNNTKPLILLSPLDWGLGHTTRCIPIIHTLLQLNCDVLVACNSRQKELLIREFPDLFFIPLEGYNVQYGTNKRRTITRIILQLPGILIKIKREHRWLKKLLQQYRPDFIISDNRFGFYARNIPSYFITHQLAIETGLGKRINTITRLLNYHFIHRFRECWVPDNRGASALAGTLSNPGKLPAIPVQYLGPLSRMQPCNSARTSIPLLIILSGPEPQRSVFEQLLLQALKQVTIATTIVRGLTGKPAPVVPAHITLYDHADAATLNSMLCAAEMIISRAGYTTVMDVLKLGKKSILVPTPGQAEQEYIAQWLLEKQLAYTVPQQAFELQQVLETAQRFDFNRITLPENYQPVLQQAVAAVSTKKTSVILSAE